MTIFHARDAKCESRKILEYAGALTSVELIISANKERYALRLILRDDVRAFMETGGDEVRVLDVADEQPETLKFGSRYHFEWWIEGKRYISFKLDEFNLTKL